jgi:hypothetical protein
MLRVPQHERKKINDINSFPFVLSAVEGLLRVFQQPAREILFFKQDYNVTCSQYRRGQGTDSFGPSTEEAAGRDSAQLVD